MDKQTFKFFKEQHQSKGCGDWWRSSQRRQAKLRACHNDLEQPIEVFKGIVDKPFILDVSNCKINTH